MSYLLDTNVISEVVRPKPNANVIKWLKNTDDSSLFISVLTLGEVRKGVEKINASKKKERLLHWLEQELPSWFEDRVITIDQRVADRWGRLLHHAGKPIAAIDSLLAATALQHDLRLVTRNTKDFNVPMLDLVNPWQFA